MSFQKRIKCDAVLRDIIKNLFQHLLREKVFVVDFGQEELLMSVHEHIRYKRDNTTEFVRYMPDLFILWHKGITKESWLLELKSAFTGLQRDDSWIIKSARKKRADLKKEEVLNIELSSWNNLLRLSELGINVAILAFVNFHPVEKWLTILPNRELNLVEVSSDEMMQTIGSGTPIANIFIRIDHNSVIPASDWLSREFEVNKEDIENFLKEQEAKLLRAWQ